jgi:hypothetical protein
MWRWFERRFDQKANPNLFPSFVALQDHYWHSYYDLLHTITSTFQNFIVSNHLWHANIHTDLSKKSSYLQLRLLKSRPCFLGKFEANWVWKVRGWGVRCEGGAPFVTVVKTFAVLRTTHYGHDRLVVIMAIDSKSPTFVVSPSNG